MERSKVAAMKTYLPNRYNNNSNYVQVVTTNVVIVNNLSNFLHSEKNTIQIKVIPEFLTFFLQDNEMLDC